MRKLQVLLSCGLIICMLIGMVGCSGKKADDNKTTPDKEVNDTTPEKSGDEDTGKEAETDKIVIGLTAANMSNESNAIYGEAAQAYAATLDNVELLFVDGEGSSDKQISQCENFVAQGVDAVILSPSDLDGCVPAAQVCADAGIPVIASKAVIADMNIVDAYVGSNDLNGGIMEMEFIAEKLGGKGNIVIIQGPTANTGAILRQQGIDKVLEEYPDIEVVYTQPADWYRDKAMALMENWMQLGTQIDAVVAHNDEMALGAYDALAAGGVDKLPFIIGIDGIAAAVDCVEEGGMTASILQDSKSIAEASIDVAIKLAKGESVDKDNDIPFALITKENVADFQ